jgi:ABC-type transport system involved in cytochrome c biogenesis permease subunit
MIRGWRGKRVAIVAVFGFLAVIITYLGVNLLLSGLHSYGEMK